MSILKTIGTTFLLFLIVGFIATIIIVNTPEDVTVPNNDTKIVSAQTKLEYSILNEKILDGPGKTQVLVNILISGEISEQNIRDLLNKLYIETKDRKGFKYHDNPTHIFIYIYTSEYINSQSQWIGMLEKIGEENMEIYINDRQISHLDKLTEEKFGLSEEQRKEIYKDIVIAEDIGMIGQEKLEFVAKKYRMTSEQMKEIQNEGFTKDWPLPPIK